MEESRARYDLSSDLEFWITAYWIHYLIDTASPYTFLSKSALKALKFDETRSLFSTIINGH